VGLWIFLGTVSEGDLGHKGDLEHFDKFFSFNFILYLAAKIFCFELELYFRMLEDYFKLGAGLERNNHSVN
jgi:hypothetical protein